MLFKHRAKTEWPDMSKIEDEFTRQFGVDIGKLLLDSLRNIYDDLKALEKAERVTTLPTAGVDYRGKFFLVPQAANDKLYICVLNTGTGVYSWREVTLT
jgi:hypothetical protein